ncbi:MAG: DinB family protein [Akkermansiaceae bacterium]|nr:DinB family protein [Armatimonadota bacterium]
MVDILLPEVADGNVALLLAALDHGTRDWRKHLGDVSPAALAWQPLPGGHSIGTILLHMADVEGYWLYEVAHGKSRSREELSTLLSEETDQGAGQWPVPPEHPLEWFYREQDVVRQRTLAVLEAVTGTTATHESPGTEFTLRWLLAHVVAHESYHGGQAVLLHEMFKAGHR